MLLSAKIYFDKTIKQVVGTKMEDDIVARSMRPHNNKMGHRRTHHGWVGPTKEKFRNLTFLNGIKLPLFM